MSCLVSPEIIITGHVIDAEEAIHIGLVNEVAAGVQALPRAQELAAFIATRRSWPSAPTSKPPSGA